MPANGDAATRDITAELFDYEFARRYDCWLRTPAGSLSQALQHRLLLELLSPKPGDTILDIGCGTGETLRFLDDLGARAHGVDRSAAMLDIARRRLRRCPLALGDAVSLPFEDASFDGAILNTTLEFLDDPEAAVRELLRVARRRVYIGVLNRWSVLAVHRRLEAHRGTDSVYRYARFYTVGDLMRLLDEAGAARCRWGGVPHTPDFLSRWDVVRQLVGGIGGWPNPFAAYVGCAADVEQLEFVRALPEHRLHLAGAPKVVIAGFHATAGNLALPLDRDSGASLPGL